MDANIATILSASIGMFGVITVAIINAIMNRAKEKRDEAREKRREEIDRERDEREERQNNISKKIDKIDEKVEEVKADIHKVKRGEQSSLKRALIQDYNSFKQKGYCTIDEKNDFNDRYKRYEDLGENGVITHIYDEVMDMPTEPSKQ